VILIHQRYRRTDRQTDRRHAISIITRPTTLCTIVHRAVTTQSRSDQLYTGLFKFPMIRSEPSCSLYLHNIRPS